MVTVESFRPNEHFPQLCDKVTVGWDRKRGRFVEALKDIPVGTVVCVEQGITVNVDPDRCYKCLAAVGEDGFAYCKNCEESYEPDELACGEYDHLGIFKLAAHLVFSYPFIEIAALLQSDDPKVPTSAPTSLSTSDIMAVYQLTPFPEIGETFKMEPVQEAIEKIVNSMESDANWGRLDRKTRLVTFTKALRIMAERCAKNAHTIYSIEQKESRNETIPLGTGLFPIASIFNHSCTPNVSAFFIRNTFVFVSHGVRAGEELVDSYGVTYNQHTLKQRTEFLANVSGFKCHCNACLNNESMDEELAKNFNNVEKCATDATCLLNISDYLEYMAPGTKDVENLIIEFARRTDSDVYTEKMYSLWKMFVSNANLRGILYDPYLVRPYIEMTLLTWNEEVECTVEEKASILMVAQRLLHNFYADLHPLSRILEKLIAAALSDDHQLISSLVARMKYIARHVWNSDDETDSDEEEGGRRIEKVVDSV